MRLDYFLPRSVTRAVFGLMGLGTASAAVGAIVMPDEVFAKQFLGDGARVQIPKMVYDPHMQMMVEPGSRLPIYSNGKNIKLATATVTAGCGDCPKNDGCKDSEGC